jgi:hypothetical protein
MVFHFGFYSSASATQVFCSDCLRLSVIVAVSFSFNKVVHVEEGACDFAFPHLVKQPFWLGCGNPRFD